MVRVMTGKNSAILVFVLCGACAGGQIDARDPPDVMAVPDVRDAAMQQDSVTVVDMPVVAQDVVTPGDGGAACMGNRDGVIERREMAFITGASVLYAVNRDGTTVDPVDTAGQTTADGRVWNLSVPNAQDSRVLDEVLRPAGQWWSSRYPDATFASVIDRGNTLLGVYRVTDTALTLLATVSSEQNRTDLRMTPPVTVLRFPLRLNDMWNENVTAAGVLNFTAFTNVTQYTTRIDATGQVWTPAGRFQALRMRTDIDQSIPLTLFRRTRKTYTFVSECWGVVARVASVDNDTTEEFRRASEYRRLGL
jgi:hypothetical protein